MAGSEEDGKGQVMAIPTLVKIAAVLLVAAVLFAGMANYLPIIRQLASRLGFGPEFQPASLQAGRAVSYAMSCSALANAWRPSITTDDNKEVKRAYRRECSEADVGSNGLDHQLPPDALDDALNKSNTNNRGDIKGKSFGGDVVVQCVSAPNKVKSGCNIYNLELPQKLGEIETLDKPYGMGGGGPLPNVARLTQSPVKWVDFYEAGWGDPKYLMYYQEFPQSLSRKWDASKMSDRFSHEMVILSAGIGAITELVGLGIGGELTEAISKKSIKTAIMGAGSKSADVATTVYRTVSNPRYALDSMQDSVGSMMRRVKPDNLLGGTDNRVSRDKVMETLLEEEGEISVKEAFEAYVGKATYVQGKSQGNIMAGAYDEVADAVDSGVSESVTQDVSEALSKALTKYEGVGGSNLDDLIARSAQGIADDEGLDAFDETVAQNALDVLKNQQDLNKLHTLVTKSDELTSDMSDDVLTAYSRTGAGYGAEDELTEGGLKKELRENIGETFDGVYLDSSDADFVYKMMGGEDYLDNMNSWFNAIKRVTRETMLSESRTVRLMKRGVSRLHGLRSGNSKAVRSLSGETWDSGDEDIFAETFENSHAYR
ncbi:MAG: hypothetical protein MUP58_02460, partial [Candidatus Nanohaloarchaeota archaeon QJJ-9]|nr:hypothetical protein [Candidatus Nanohaloarchaeota archaeon QJJ-9]